MGLMVNNHTLALMALERLSTINPWLLCSNYNINMHGVSIIAAKSYRSPKEKARSTCKRPPTENPSTPIKRRSPRKKTCSPYSTPEK